MAIWLTIEEAAQHLKIGKSTLYQMARDGKVSAQKLGRSWRFDAEDLDSWMKRNQLDSHSDRSDR